ncbi:MAG TPA: 2-amino-4-hydroxy-6-hydroxymethyldihydropteridine diphosphokinase [Candidatus Ornithomonoglobus merdipullorum]|uniref:Bifunctional folate synthesis protein n=1 Tax=Candidatus Ornithomonoglobus merdipullorum TaxID=2840895 RepID=A0A9D1MDW1_9FIRM|nr:2-amino-4-hydroxy-6-hydroxymethyldihydropteridine diphosphokinase [Candidatus Ornithomonoglobus merdipullorum]
MDDCIMIDNLVVFANHGVYKEEKTMGQRFVISMKLYADLYPAAKSDDLTKALNYAEICSFVTKFTQTHRCCLIEAAAVNIADALLKGYPAIDRVEITLKKPWAPIGLPLDQAAVHLTRSRHRAYIGIGSNLGDKKGYLDLAVRSLDEDENCIVRRVSDYIVTKPVGEVEQDDFLNGCIELDTLYTPHELLDRLHEIENAAGRTRDIHWGPRTLDLDILLYDSEMIHDETLTIPHPEMHKRTFVLEPLSQIAPFAKNPVLNKCAATLLERIKQQ